MELKPLDYTKRGEAISIIFNMWDLLATTSIFENEIKQYQFRTTMFDNLMVISSPNKV